jgi:hypothetical protein
MESTRTPPIDFFNFTKSKVLLDPGKLTHMFIQK